MNFNKDIEQIDVSRETFDEIEWYFQKHYSVFKKYANQIVWWNAKFNLVSRNQSSATILEHIRHSLSICITEEFWKARVLVDAGTGGGFPGVPLSLIHDDLFVHLVDTNQKKVTAINQMTYTLEIDRVNAICSPIDSFELNEKAVLVTKHAFKLDEFFAMNHKIKYDSYMFLKGHDFAKELNESILENYSVKAYNLESGTGLSFFNHKYLVQLDPK